VVTKGGQQFVTPLALAALSENQVYTNLFDLKNEAEMGHIQLSREADLVVVCPATADLIAKIEFLKARDIDIDHYQMLADLRRVFGVA
jgi:phosphopantothenoylcysteine decarboxylase/phosphopantothenate--cysteine ligase